MSAKDKVAAVSISIAAIICLLIMPGLDIIAWHVLRPAGFWERVALVVIEMLAIWPRIVVMGVVLAFSVGILDEF